ncbi:MAG TPA: NADH-quinone oxidoreductase subunit M [Polyangiaceae bacterium]|nr:MAG: NADH-quinone oxidoreductase subunit M [Deltaproteobacteria bacterium ADurb.Bin207]HNS96841.1 NADH-quinone oxidoreductase subunit M [Polyangiaceae bacterium]HNZ21574.1 NADH-quinone oxidoreductase subunit M [Polyangiaceae bacterium]HOD21714.1 NADH-quinone oxidoreductase subunit M [Polyangiaceae bacterium]HOE48127.1 NADH-quinone oxidoreductase subunit M [Polyangiaceae bacterium]
MSKFVSRLYWVTFVSWLVVLVGATALAQTPPGMPSEATTPEGIQPVPTANPPLPSHVSPRLMPGPRVVEPPVRTILPGQPELRIEGKRGGPLEMVWDGKVFTGTFEVHNVGTGNLMVTRVAVRQGDNGPWLPPGTSAQLEGNQERVLIAPDASHKVMVRWEPGDQAQLKEWYGHVLVETNAADQQPLAMGVHAELPLGGAPWLFNHILSWLVFLPILGMLAIFALYLAGYKKDENLKWGVLGLMGVELAGAIWLFSMFNRNVGRWAGNEGFQFIERGVWIRSLNVEYFVGVDGTSISMVLLTALVSFVAVLASFSVKTQLKGYWAMFLLLVTGMMGVFVALDLFLFYVFWEVMLLPMYFLIGIWGGPRKEYAAIKFFLYTLAGSVFMLLAFIAMYYTSGPAWLVDGSTVAHTFSIPELMRVDFLNLGQPILGLMFVKVVWVVLFIAFAIKVPMFPFHTWLPDAHVEAPTAISVILAGVLLKMGTYGMLRLNFGLLPEATQWAAPAMAVFGVISILYGAFCAMAQEDLKRLVAYSSISHMGFCLLGMGAMTPHGIEAAIVQMFNHGTITAMLFSLVGVIYDRAHTREIGKFGGMATEMPFYSAFFGFAFMASLGLPGLSGFIGEALTFVGAFPVYPALTILAASGVIFSAAYHLWAMQRIFLGKFRESWRSSHALEEFGGKFPEINLREIMTLAPMAVVVLILGFWPRPLLDLIDAGVLDLTALVNPPVASQTATYSEAARQFLALLP